MTIIRRLSMRDYHGHSAITNTRLKVFRASPMLYNKVYNNKTVKMPETDAMRFGRAIDCLVFDGREEFGRQYVTAPRTYENEDGETKPWTMRANYCKAWERNEVMRGRSIVCAEDHVCIEQMLQALTHHPIAAALMSQGESQVTFRRESGTFGLEVQVRPDWFSEKPLLDKDLGIDTRNLPYLCDLKSTVFFDKFFNLLDPEDPRLGRPVIDLGMYRQAGMAQWVAAQDVGPTDHFLVIAESIEPFRAGVIRLNNEYLELGFSEVSSDLHRLRACQTANVWPGSVGRIIELKPPQWLLDAGSRQSQANAEAGAPSAESAETVDVTAPRDGAAVTAETQREGA